MLMHSSRLVRQLGLKVFSVLLIKTSYKISKKYLENIWCKDLSNFTNLTKKFKTVNTLTNIFYYRHLTAFVKENHHESHDGGS